MVDGYGAFRDVRDVVIGAGYGLGLCLATSYPAASLSRGLERDRAVDETGGEIAVFGRIGCSPFTLDEMHRFVPGPRRQPVVRERMKATDRVPGVL